MGYTSVTRCTVSIKERLPVVVTSGAICVLISEMNVLEIPRLTGSLRAFSGLSLSSHVTDSEGHELVRKRKIRAKKQREGELNWTELKTAIHDCIVDDSNAKTEVKILLRELLQTTKEIYGAEADIEALQEAAVSLFDILKGCEQLSQTESAKIRSLFGAFPASSGTKLCHIIQSIYHLISSEKLAQILRNKKSKENNEQLAEFGEGIPFFQPEIRQREGEEEWSSSSDEEGESVLDTFLRINHEQSSKKKEEKTDQSSHSSVNQSWLMEECQKHSVSTEGGLNAEDLFSALFEMLSSERNNEAIQNDLLELLGFDAIDLISKILQERYNIVTSILDGGHESVGQGKEYIKRSKNTSTRPDQSQPKYGCQVVIQSEEEKLLMKQARKEGRRQARRDKGDGDDGVDQETYLKELGFDPEMLAAQRESALFHASSKSLFSKTERQTRPREIYPHVYDEAHNAQAAFGFVAGTKICLPTTAKRKITKTYEEVSIPHSQNVAVVAGERLVPISELDEIGQAAFKGMKSLNRIQSIVYDSAYNTNENLLICAPTGAGKTNIAMMTIVREIKQNIEQGVIRKDKFKIVYVAPMKALAAEMVRNFGRRLSPLGISVRELTGDMQLTKAEIHKTQMLVTTPEKWDVVTRKSTGDVALAQLVKLLIIDEVHLLHDDRGSVIECLVARTLRQVETSQSMIRIVGLSATLPNFMDVACFLRVSPYEGLFVFDGRFRPVPLGQTFIGVKGTSSYQVANEMDKVCYDKVLENVEKGHQVMVFVHARNATVKTAMVLRELANNHGDSKCFRADQDPQFGAAEKQVTKSRNKPLRDLFPDGFSTHHAGMLRQDRTLVEQLFSKGLIKVLVCTATLAWGVNLPAHAVVIKGTQVYDAKKGSFVDIGILDVLQIFGRAGRPQYDKFGEGTIITTHDRLTHYLSLLTRQTPIESTLTASLADSLNAEITLGTVTTIDEAVKWLSYSYLYIRMTVNPLVYGISYKEKEDDPLLENYRRKLVVESARKLDKAQMIRYTEKQGYLSPTDLGRTSSHFYIKCETIETFNERFGPNLTLPEILEMLSHSLEFEQVKVREDEMAELEEHLHEDCLVHPVKGGVENSYGKVNILLQTYISRGHVESFSLVSDLAYVAQNCGRLVRGLFDIALRKGYPTLAVRLLTLSKTIDKRLWHEDNPLRQFTILGPEILNKLEARRATIPILRDMRADDIGHLVHHVRMGQTIKSCVKRFPSISIAASIQPITRTVLRVRLTIRAEFEWNDKLHGNTEPWWIWVEDPDRQHIYHSEYFLLHKKQVLSEEDLSLVFTIPIIEPLPPQYYVHAVSDRWLAAETVCAISFQHLILPEKHPPHTELLDLQPLPVSALNNVSYQMLYKFTHFNPVQTQVFHTVYNTDHNVLLGAPTGSGKTAVAELAIFRVFEKYPGSKTVYIAPLKALVRERIEDWKVRFGQKLGKRVIELTGDVAPDARSISQADVIVTTPEKWDGISRSWQTRNYVRAVKLLVIDEIHLLGDDRGPVLEVIVSRSNFISSHTENKVRVVGLSTALANAQDLADWLDIGTAGMFNFRPSVRPVPLEVHITGFPGKHYCPRMATMNKPTFKAILTHSPDKPVLVFVSSRRQTRLTALDLIAFLAAEDNPKQWLHMPEEEMDFILRSIHDNNLKLTLSFGIGLHHAGLHEHDRKTIEELFVNQKIQILIATSTLAWGVNFPAHLVVIKGTEYFDGKTCRYVDFPITDVLQMMGRAGRPQFDDQGTAVILVHDIKKHFYKKFLYEPFPVESSLLEVLPEHLNAEIVAGTISSKQDAMDYLTWTYFFRRLVMNPTYYDLQDTDHDSINAFLSELVEKATSELQSCGCLQIEEDNVTLSPTTPAQISSYYYLSHLTMRMFSEELNADCSLPDLLKILADAEEYTQLPVRHNEDALNKELSEHLPLEVPPHSFDDPHTKANLLFQAHFSRVGLPISDFLTDQKSVLDQAIRILQAMIDLSADEGWLATSLRIMHIVQMVIQGRWLQDSTLMTLPSISDQHLPLFVGPRREPIESLPELLDFVGSDPEALAKLLRGSFSANHIEHLLNIVKRLPVVGISVKLRGAWADGDGAQQEERPLDIETLEGRHDNWSKVHADQEYSLNIELKRLNRFKGSELKAHAPYFPKAKSEGWWMVLGDTDSGELLALKRIGNIRSSTRATLSFYTPEIEGRKIYTLYLISDCYLGLDQQYDLYFEIVESSIVSQFITEVTL
ncbi:activating signal cointegrator 1 complex subunit 3-like [Actinia tenebrosa]|uniref:Activating signal cointegrator 1 complex subunit 3 n=1 Tax=Actinia tenebrosa TaxID=6105 RepID=A0A6P8HNX3_ACTTE|nr:activating signal cointegrator 1 complex subunit 3-like [Actinia tenebrosa]